jgi:hypothetical protein
MSKSQNTKNERNADVSKTLTEQWKKGELPSGWYYIKIADIVFIDFFEGKVWKNKKDKYIDEVITEVPSYEEWKEKDDALTALLAEYGKLTKELQDEKEKHKTRPSLRSPADEMVIEKQVWESTLHRSMKLQAENETLKEALKDCQEKILQMDYDSIKIEILQKINEVLK